MADRYHTYSFHNGTHVVDLANTPLLYVKAARRIDHGDWKTQSVRDYFMGMEIGQVGKLVEIWDNMYGRWCKVDVGDRNVDVRSTELIVITKEEHDRASKNVA